MRALAIVGLVAALQLPAAVSAQVEDDAGRTAMIDSLFDEWRGTAGPGCAVGVENAGHVILERAYGMANLEVGAPNRPSTVFHAASLAKQVTAMAVLLLVRDGVLDLDVDVRATIPELPDYGWPISPRQLLTHTSGVRDYVEMLILARGRFEEDRITRRDALDVIARQDHLNFPPGTEYLYSNSGYFLLALMVERISGQAFPDFTRERIFRPLGMSQTRFRHDYTELVPGRAEGYARSGSGWRRSSPNYDVYGPTNLLTTVHDLLLWLANLDEPVVGDSAMVSAMTTTGRLENGDVTDYGFGIGLADYRGLRVHEHEGSDPGFRAYAGRFVDGDVGVAVLCNTRSANAVEMGHRVGTAFLEPPEESSQPYRMVVSGSVQPDAGRDRAGLYFQPDRVEIVELAWRQGALYTSPRGGRRLLPIGGDQFQVENLPVVHTFGESVPSGYTASTPIPNHHPVEFEWRDRWTPGPRELEAFAGVYTSAELRATYDIAVQDSTLAVSIGSSGSLELTPMFKDTFRSGQLVVEFEREAGHVIGFYLSHPRARRVSFRLAEGRH